MIKLFDFYIRMYQFNLKYQFHGIVFEIYLVYLLYIFFSAAQIETEFSTSLRL